jgi:hypothetical protein
MKKTWDQVERWRRTDIPGFRSRYGDRFGLFDVEFKGMRLFCIVTDGDVGAVPCLPAVYRWEHVSVSTKNRTPNWYEMAFIKDLFWDESETVMQLHVPKSEHKNLHPHVLHLWRPLDHEIPRPPSDTVA